MDKENLAKFKAQLEDERKKIISGLDHIEKETLNQSQRDSSGDLSGYSFHMADQATDNFGTELNLDLASGEQRRLNEIVDALKRIEDGTYGICETCKKPISAKRLKAVPYARCCIKCQEESENKKS